MVLGGVLCLIDKIHLKSNSFLGTYVRMSKSGLFDEKPCYKIAWYCPFKKFTSLCSVRPPPPLPIYLEDESPLCALRTGDDEDARVRDKDGAVHGQDMRVPRAHPGHRLPVHLVHLPADTRVNLFL